MKIKYAILLFSLEIFALQSCEKKKAVKSELKTADTNTDIMVSPMAHIMDSANVRPLQKFSTLKNRNIPILDSAITLKSLTELTTENSYLIFNKDQSKSELFLPNAKNSLILERKGTEGNFTWTDGTYELIQWKGYVLRSLKDTKPLFGGDSM